LAIAKNELRIMRRQLVNLLQIVILPFIMMAFFKPLFRSTLESEGFRHASGAEQAVPGLSVLFALFLVSGVGFAFFMEHGWGTWERLRASAATPIEIVVGKLVPNAAVAIIQQTVLLVAGIWLLGLHVAGSYAALVLLVLALTLALLAIGVAVAAFFRNAQQLNTAGSLGAILIGGLGGGLAPVATLPAWARAIAPVTPSYWAIRAYRSVVLGGGIGDVLSAVGVLSAFTVVFTVVALRRFRFDDVKVVQF
jgi:ABC-2 type transport system permease protein